MIYIIYIIFTSFFVLLLNADKIAVKLKTFKILFLKAKNNANIVRDISLGFFINGVFSMFNASSLIAFLGYGLLTLIAAIGIINANNKKG